MEQDTITVLGFITGINFNKFYMSQKTTFQNWVDKEFKTQKAFCEKAKIQQGNFSKEYNSPNGLRKISKYAKKLGYDSVTVSGYEYGMKVDLVNVKIT